MACCDVDYRILKMSSLFEGVIIAGMTVVGAVAAPLALTAVTVGSVALAVGLFAAPAAAVGLGMGSLISFVPKFRDFFANNSEHKERVYVALWIQAGVFALLSAAACTAGVLLGVFTTPLMVTFIVATAVVTVALAALGFIFKD